MGFEGMFIFGVVFWAAVLWGGWKLLKWLMKGSSSSDSLASRMERLERLVADQDARLVRLEEGRPLPKVVPEPIKPESRIPKVVPPPSRVKPVEPSMETVSMEEKVAGRWFQWIAIVAILVGTGYFLKLAFDNKWIGEMGRVMLGWISGIAFLIMGQALIQKYRGYAHGLIGGGLGLIYLATFAGFSYYHLLDGTPAFFIMALTTVVGVGLAIRDDSETLAVLAVLGGFLTPWLVSTGVDRQVELMSYLIVLNVGVLAVSGFKHWQAIRYGSFGLTVMYCVGWGQQFYTTDKLWITLGFHAVFYALFSGMAFLYDIVKRRKSEARDVGFSLVNALLFYLTSYALLTNRVFGEAYRPVAALLALGLAGWHVWQAYVAFDRRGEGHPPYLPMVLMGMGVAFVTVAIGVQLDASWITVGWAAEAAVLMWAGWKSRHAGTRAMALGILSLVLFRLLAYDGWEPVQQVLFNKRFLPFAAGIGCSAWMGWWLSAHKDQLDPAERGWLGVLVVAANFLAMWYLSLEVADYWNLARRSSAEWETSRAWWYSKQVSLSLLWLFYGAFMMVFGILRVVRDLRLLAIATLGVTIVKVFFWDLSGLPGGYRVLSLIGLGVILLLISFGYQRYKSKITSLVKEG